MKSIVKIMLILTLACALTSVNSSGVCAQSGTAAAAIAAYYSNNKKLMVPLRQVITELGGDVFWSEPDRTVSLHIAGNHVVFNPNLPYYFLNGQSKAFSVFPQNKNGNLMVSFDIILDITEGQVIHREEEGAVLRKQFESFDGNIHNLKFSLCAQDEIYPFSREKAARVPILMYHEVDDVSGRKLGQYLELFVEPAVFVQQLDWLKENNYSTVTLAELYAHWYQGEPIKENPVVLSFDDGFCNMYKIVMPELVKRDMVATFFLHTAAIGSEKHLEEEMIREMVGNGMEIGCHSDSHASLTELDKEGLEKELLNSKQLLEDITGQEVSFFCYPFGKYNSSIIDKLKNYFYQGAVTVKEGQAAFYQDPFQWPRLNMRYQDGFTGFVRKMEALRNNMS